MDEEFEDPACEGGSGVTERGCRQLEVGKMVGKSVDGIL